MCVAGLGVAPDRLHRLQVRYLVIATTYMPFCTDLSLYYVA